jgi:FADH2 O2-dependent halogenase
MLPSAAAFVDPILSTGFPLTLLGIERLAASVETSWGTPALTERLAIDAQRTFQDADAAGRLVAALFASFDDLTKLYFASRCQPPGRPQLSWPLPTPPGPAPRDLQGGARPESRAVPGESLRRSPLDVMACRTRPPQLVSGRPRDLLEGASAGRHAPRSRSLRMHARGPPREPTEAQRVDDRDRRGSWRRHAGEAEPKKG